MSGKHEIEGSSGHGGPKRNSTNGGFKMAGQMATILTSASVILGVFSAACWLRSSLVKISHAKAMETRAKLAAKRGEKPNFASASLDGWDMSATFAAQGKWNACGALLAAGSILAQSVAQAIA